MPSVRAVWAKQLNVVKPKNRADFNDLRGDLQKVTLRKTRYSSHYSTIINSLSLSVDLNSRLTTSSFYCHCYPALKRHPVIKCALAVIRVSKAVHKALMIRGDANGVACIGNDHGHNLFSLIL